MKYGIVICLIALGCGNNSTGGGTSLVGTWELAGAMGGPAQGTLILTASHLTVNLGGDVFDLQVDGTPALSWTDHNRPASISATHTGGGVNLGILPLALGGDWTFTGASGGQCSASLQSASIIGSCAGAGYSPLLALNRHATATRIAKLDSVFGDLGGTWTVSDGGGSCTITLQSATIMGSCGGGGVSMTFGDGVVSGHTDSGGEFSARRQ
jgi:hypothetical protein